MNKKTVDAFVGLGGNIGDSKAILLQAYQMMRELPEIESAQLSQLFETKPVSSIPQRQFLNAVCKLRTTLGLKELFVHLEAIEKALGKVPKIKEAARIIDLDLLLFGTETCHEDPIVPHPHWHKRLFVLLPLSTVTNEVILPDQTKVNINDLIDNFEGVNEEEVVPLT